MITYTLTTPLSGQPGDVLLFHPTNGPVIVPKWVAAELVEHISIAAPAPVELTNLRISPPESPTPLATEDILESLILSFLEENAPTLKMAVTSVMVGSRLGYNSGNRYIPAILRDMAARGEISTITPALDGKAKAYPR